MAQVTTLVNAVLAVVPAAVVFFLAYGRYDGTFRDNVVFLYFIGGLIMGGVLGFVGLLALETLAPLVAVILLALLWPISMTLGVNRRKWQGERHSVFNGGAFGLGVSVMLSFTFLFRVYREHSLVIGVQAFVVAAALAGICFGLGLLAGNSVRLRQPLRYAFLGTAIILAPVIFLQEFYRQQAWLFPILLLAYGAIFGVLAERRILLEGVAEEARKERRRRRRRAQRGA